MAESKLRVDILADVKGFDRAMSKAQSRLSSFGKSATKIGKTMSMNLTLPITLAGTVAVNQAIKFEKLQTTLNVLTGSAEEGAKAFDKLVKFSAETPFQLTDLVKVNNTLMGFGMSADNAFENTKRLGDIAGIVGGDLNGIAVAFGQASAEGTLFTRDIRQFINNSVPLPKLLAKELGVAEGSIMKLAEQGKISFEILERALKNATTGSGEFAGGTKILSQTLGGLLSTLRDRVNMALAEFGKAIAEAFNLSENIPKIAKFIGDLTEKFKDLQPSTQRILIVFTGLTAVAGPLLIMIGKLAMGITGLIKVAGFAKIAFKALTKTMKANPFILVATAIAGVVLALKNLKSASAVRLEEFQKSLENISTEDAQKKLQELTDKLKENKVAEEQLAKVKSGRKKGTMARDLKDENLEIQNQIDVLKELIKARKEEQLLDTEPEPKARGPVSGISPGSMPGFATMGGDLAQSLTINPDIAKRNSETVLSSLRKNISNLRLAGDQTREAFADISGAVGSGLANIASGIGSGSMGIGQVGGMLLSTLGDIAIHLGKTAIQIGLAMEAIKMSFKNPFTAIAAGIALIAIGSFIKNAGNIVSGGSGPKEFAKGGVVTGPTLGLIGEGIGTNRGNPEIVAPLDRLQSMIQPRNQRVEVGGQFSINGQDLVLVLQRANSDRTRLV